jgi:hypothetical protein
LLFSSRWLFRCFWWSWNVGKQVGGDIIENKNLFIFKSDGVLRP